MGEPTNPHFCDFGIWGRVPKPQNQYYLSLETPGQQAKIKKISGTFQKYYVFFYFQVRESPAPLNIPTPIFSMKGYIVARSGLETNATYVVY